MPGPGDLDTSFGSGGKKTITFGGVDGANAVLQPNGRIVVSGSSNGRVAVARLNADGAPDTTFGTAGKAIVDFGVATFANALARQANGRLVVAGDRTVSDDFALARLLA